MVTSLNYLGTLPDKTIVYDGHEYTAGNLKFAKSVDPENPSLKRLEGIVGHGRTDIGATTIADEKEWNPFMRLRTEAIL